MTLYEMILHEKETFESRIRELDNRIAALPTGSLVCRKSGSRYKYYREISDKTQKTGKKLIYLTRRNTDLIHALAEKTLLRRERQECRDELHALNLYLTAHRNLPDKAYERLIRCRPIYDLIYPRLVKQDEKIQQWMNEIFESNPNYPDALTVPSVDGTMVRSKSEAFIAFQLRKFGIPFRYECRLTLGSSVSYPDFTILHPGQYRIIIWEHFGMMDNPEYRSAAARKIRYYIENGLIPGDNLIMTFESSSRPLDLQTVEKVIHDVFL